MIDGQDQSKRGILWLGSAAVLARILDVGATLTVVGLLTKEEMGLAALALSACAILESLSGIGIGSAIVQSEGITAREESSLFWLTSAIGLALGSLLVALAPLLAAFYAQAELTPLIAFSGLKLLLVGMSVVPLQLLSKRLQFKEIGAVQTLASLGEGSVKIVFAFAGAGAWALVLGNVGRGLVLLAALAGIAAFRPQLHFAYAETRRFVRFGLRVAGSSVIYQLYKNADYFLVGKFLGVEVLGLYRVAFDVAMQPTEAVMVVVGRAGFPVYSRLAQDLSALRKTFLSNTRSLLLMVAPVAAFIFFATDELLELLGGGRWSASVPAVQILVWAGLLRAATVVFPQVYVAVGRPHYATLDSAVTFVLLTLAFWGGLTAFPELGMLSVCYAWLLAYPILLGWHLTLIRRIMPLDPLKYLRFLASGLAPAPVIFLGLWLMRRLLSWAELGWMALGVFAVAAVLIFSGYLRWVLKVRWRDLVPRRAPRSASLAGSK